MFSSILKARSKFLSHLPPSPKSLVRSSAIQPPVSRNPPLVKVNIFNIIIVNFIRITLIITSHKHKHKQPLIKARSGSAMSEAPSPSPQITVISDPTEVGIAILTSIATTKP